MTEIDTDAARDALVEALRLDPADKESRGILADLLEDAGEDDLASVQRELIGLEPYRLGTGEAEEILEAAASSGWFGERTTALELWVGFDFTLNIHVFQIRWERGSDEDYVVCRGDCALCWATLRRRAGLGVESGEIDGFGRVASRKADEDEEEEP